MTFRTSATMALATALTMSMVTGSAHAIGLCEGLETTYTLEAVDEAAGLLLVRGTTETCSETDSGDEKRATLSFAQLVGLDGKVHRTFGKRRHARALADQLGVAKVEPTKLLKDLQSKKTMVPARARSGPGASPCTTRVARKRAGKRDGFPQVDVTVTIGAGKPLKTVALGAAAKDAGQQVTTLFLPKRRAVAIWSVTGSCSGPPPGYFGEEDEGTCQAELAMRVRLLSVVKGGPLEACFPPSK